MEERERYYSYLLRAEDKTTQGFDIYVFSIKILWLLPFYVCLERFSVEERI
jgi:hypothetical protein